MASDIYSMLTGGYDPRAEQMKQQQAFQQQLGQATNPQAFIAAVGSNLGGMLGQGIEKIAGVKDPREEKEKLKKEAIAEVQASGVNMSDQVAVLKAIVTALQKRGLTAEAMMAQQEATKVAKQAFEVQGLEDAQKARTAVADILAKNPNATSQELYAAAAPFSSNPEAIIKAVAAKEEKAAAEAAAKAAKEKAAQDRLEQIRLQGQQQLDIAKQNAQARIDAATIAGASREQIAQMQAESRKEIAQMQIESREQSSQMMGQIRLDIAKENNATRREIEAEKRNTGVLAPSLQKEEGADLALVDNYEAMSAVLDTPVKALTPDAKGVVSLQLDPASRASYAARNYVGRSTPESRAYADLQASVAQAVNIKTDAAKGVQTDKDVLRFANALIEASARNDVKATREALQKFQDAAKVAAEKTKVRINSRRQAQNVGVYFTDVATPEGTSPGGGVPKRATKRYNPATGKLEVIGG